MSESEKNMMDGAGFELESRLKIALGVLRWSILGILFLSIAYTVAIAFLDKSKFAETAKYVFAAIVPLIATWVGTVLAYYFSKENFESANRSVSRLVEKLTPEQILRKVPVKEKMIPRSKIDLHDLKKDGTEDQTKLEGDILRKMDQMGRRRLPVIDENGHPRYIIHRSLIDRYLTRKVVKDNLTPDAIKELTLKELLDDDSELKIVFEEGFGVVDENATMADAKCEMEKTNECQDVFVTRQGSKNEPISGWVTNVIISQTSEV